MRVNYVFKLNTRKITISSYHPKPLSLNESKRPEDSRSNFEDANQGKL